MIDTRVHCLLYFLSPSGHGLKPLDLEVMRQLASKVNLLPVIGKADSLTQTETKRLKARILEELRAAEIPTYQMDSEEVTQQGAKQPFTVVGANAVAELGGKTLRVRQYPGFGQVEVENPDHCDFTSLRSFLVAHITYLKQVTRDVHYEKFRVSAMKPFQRMAEAMKRRRNSNTMTNFNNNLT